MQLRFILWHVYFNYWHPEFLKERKIYEKHHPSIFYHGIYEYDALKVL